MKRVSILFLTLCICLSVLPAKVYALRTDLNYTEDEAELVVRYFEHWEDIYGSVLRTQEAVGYWNMIREFRSRPFVSWAIDVSSKMIEEYPDERDYAEILSNLMAMQSGDLAEQVQTQSRFDDLDGTGDYLWEVVDIATEFIGANQLLETVSPIIDAATGGHEALVESGEHAKYYEMSFLEYANSHAFLSAVSSHADNPGLRKVAGELLRANESLLEKRLEYLADVSGSLAEFEADFFLENLSFELLEQSDAYVSSETVQYFVNSASKLVKNIMTTKSTAHFAFKMTMLAGDIGFGTSSMYNRYQEMCVLTDITEALIKAVDAVNMSETANNVEKLDRIQEKAYYYQGLIVTHARGEYLVYQLLMEDAGILSDVRWIMEYLGEEENSTEAWYKSQVAKLLEFHDALNDLFVLTEEDYELMEIIASEKEEEEREQKPFPDWLLEEVESDTGLVCVWQLQGDFDDNGEQELYALFCRSKTSYAESELWYATEEKGRCLFWLDANVAKAFHGVVKRVPQWAAIGIVQSLILVDDFLSDIS